MDKSNENDSRNETMIVVIVFSVDLFIFLMAESYDMQYSVMGMRMRGQTSWYSVMGMRMRGQTSKDFRTTDSPTTDSPTTDFPTTNFPTTDSPTTNLKYELLT